MTKHLPLRVAFSTALLLLASMFAPPLCAQMNIVVVNTDDQRFDTLSRMPNLAALATQGVRFTNAFQATPLCGPSRASMFSGGYLSQNTGVLENNAPNGEPANFNDRDTLGTVLQSAGYRTHFVGKWINGYEKMGAYVPPGWDRFVGRKSSATSTSWFEFKYIVGSSNAYSSGSGTQVSSSRYTTDFERDDILNSIARAAASSQPFFILWNPSAPHARATPAVADQNLFSNYVYTGRGYGEVDLSDKPWWVRHYVKPTSGTADFVRRQLRTLQAIDRSVDAIVDKLRSIGELDNTVIVFTSDNGYMWGEHGLWAKLKSYEESVRVPLVILMPGVVPRNEPALVSVSLDLGPTLYAIAGVPRQTDGRNLLPLLHQTNQSWRNDIFLENYGSGVGGNALWIAIRNHRWKYVRYWGGDEELYDLQNDPYELNSRHADPALATLKSQLRARATQQAGLAMLPVRTLPDGRRWTRYSFGFEAWTGTAPYTWKVHSGSLPPGLSLNESTGVLQGIPTALGTYKFSVRLLDSVVATHTGKPRTFISLEIRITVT